MDARQAVVITGMGLVSPIGANVAELSSALLESRSGIRQIQAPPLARAYPAAMVTIDPGEKLSALALVYLDRCQQLALLAAGNALHDAGLDRMDQFGDRAGLYYGNVNGGSATAQDAYRQLFCEQMQAGKPYVLMAVMQNGGAAQISIKHGITGPVHTHGSACAASGAALGEAARAIRDGYLDIAVAGGAEAPLTGAMFCGFEGARALARVDPGDVARSCRPFDTRRSGLVLGEGAAFLVLESERHALARGAACLAYLAGYGSSADAHHIAMPFANGQARAIRMALDDAGLDPSQLHYFNAHGTATRGGDPVEASAIRSVFGSGSASVPVSSTKSLHGHLLGAAGALECIVAVMAIRRRLLPATAGLEQPDPACMLNHIASVSVPNQDIHTAMSLSCGFGGTNVALLVSKYMG
nr:beta-ketoacyl-[acyl-carrier-protein] synthase family protein [uncultured Noviherbaspirillum sp.]